MRYFRKDINRLFCLNHTKNELFELNYFRVHLFESKEIELYFSYLFDNIFYYCLKYIYYLLGLEFFLLFIPCFLFEFIYTINR